MAVHSAFMARLQRGGKTGDLAERAMRPAFLFSADARIFWIFGMEKGL